MMWTRIFQIKDTIFALIIPNYLMGAFNIFLLRNYFTNSIPVSLIESAQLDGAKELTIFFKIILRCLPGSGDGRAVCRAGLLE